MNPEPSPSSHSRQNPHHIALNIPQYTGLQKQTQTCPICTEEYPANEILIPLPCKHPFCSSCLKEYLFVKINANQVLNIPCPQSSCTETFTDKSLEEVLDPDMFTRYHNFASKKLALKGPKRHFCSNPRCSNPFTYQVNRDFNVCTSCGTKTCNRCDSVYHEGRSCIESMDPDFEKYAKENGIKYCMMCRTVVERDGGCAQITCSVCDYQWCWVCGRNYERIHICKGAWDPVPPDSVLNNEGQLKAYIKRVWNESSGFKLIGLITLLVVLSPVLLLGFLIILPVGRIELSKQRPMKSFCSIVGAILCAPLFWLILICAFFVYAAFFVLLSPFLLIAYIVSWFQGQGQSRQGEQSQATKPTQPKKRWQTRDSQNFAYRNSGVNTQM